MNGGSSNPSDYQFLLRTLAQGNHIAKAESLKRFNTLILSDKKQFSSYAKRIVIAIQELMLQSKQDINLLACTLALEIINLNPRDIQFYIKNKLMKSLVVNLGDAKPQIRKTSHYCLLAYIRTFKNFDDLIEIYIANGIMSKQWQLRQKSINSFQSILVMEMRYVDWSSSEFKRIFELLLSKLKDENGFVQKAAQQCLLSLSKVEQLRNFSKNLNAISFNLLKCFCQQHYQLGNLNQIKLDLYQNKVQYEKNNQSQTLNQNLFLMTNKQKSNMAVQRSEPRIDLKIIPSNFKQTQEESYRKKPDRYHFQKAESSLGPHQTKNINYSLNLKQMRNPEREDRAELKRESSLLLPPISNPNPAPTSRLQKIEQTVGKKLVEDLRNDKDWKVRLQAIEQLQTKFQLNREEFELDFIMKNLVPLLIKLLGDGNFKVALVALKIIKQILRIPNLNLQQIVPQIVQKLSDNKVALRQNISKLIKSEYTISREPVWLDNLLLHIKKNVNSNVKQQVLNILHKFYEEDIANYSFQRMLEVVCPLMEDLKTKIKIKTLDLLAIITIKCEKIDRAKNIISGKMNQVYYEMYLQKIGKQLKSMKDMNKPSQKENNLEKQIAMTTSMNTIQKKIHKIGNTTSTSLQRYAPSTQEQHNSTVKTAFYEATNSNQKAQTIRSKQEVSHYEAKLPEEIRQIENISITDDEASSSKKNSVGSIRNLRRRGQKSVQSRLSTTNYSNEDVLPPFSDPQKQIKNLMLQIRSDDWQLCNQGLTKLLRIIKHHIEILNTNTTKIIIPDIMRLSESLRSTLSKSALVVIYELSNKLKRQLDTQFDLIFSKLIKKSLDTNTFISEQVKKALVTVCSNSNENKVLNSLNTSHISRAIPIKIAVVNILEGITFLPKFYQKELQKIVTILVDFLNEGSLQIRQKTKNLLNSILNSEKGSSVLKLIPVEHRTKLKKIQQTSPVASKCELKLQSLIQQKKPQVSIVKQVQQFYPRKKKKIKITNFPEEFEKIDSYLDNCQNSDWKIRLEYMTIVYEICSKYTQEIVQHKSSSRIIDILSKQINDPNFKVASNALKIFQQLTQKIPALIETSLSVMLNQIFICFSSMKNQIKLLAEELFNSLSNSVEKWMLTQHICNGALYSIQKSRPTIIQKLTLLVPQIYKAKPNIFQKNVYPMINKLADQNKPELNGPLKNLLQVLVEEVGDDCLSFLKQKARQVLQQ